jgi:hypothetical protein
MPLLVVLERLSEVAVLAVATGRQAAVLAGIAEFCVPDESAAASAGFSRSVTEHRVWHLEYLRHGGSSGSGHEGWHVLGRIVGS